MNKAMIIDEINAARRSHVDWVMKAKMLIEGLEIDKDSIPVNATSCGFGRWFYSEAQKINSILNQPMQCMHTIEELHMNLHNIYLEIYKIYYATDKQGFFSKLFNRHEKISKEAEKNAHEYFKQLEYISKALIKELEVMEKKIMLIEDKELQLL